MNQNIDTVSALNTGVYIIHQKEVKTPYSTSVDANIDKVTKGNDSVKKKSWQDESAPTFIHYFTLVTLGLLSWGILWCAFGEGWRWDGQWFRIAAVAVIAWGSGQILESLTTLPPLLAALLTGILARHFGFLDMRHHTHIDAFLRRIYPVIILGKGSLGWDISYMKANWRRVVTLGALPWCMEVTTLAICAHMLLGFPWLWGFLLGSIYSSVSCPVIMPAVNKHGKNSNGKQNWPQLICTAGGLDTALSVGVYGIINSFMFYETTDLYRYIKAALTLFVGSALGVIWGSLAKYLPNSRDTYVTELRILFVLVGGLFANFFTTMVGWGGTAGVAVLACNSTAAKHWASKGWKLNQNPASKVYRVLWSSLEPLVFAYTGTFFVMHHSISDTMLIGLGILLICLTVRLFVIMMVCWDLQLKERIFICCTAIPKSIVEAVLAPMAIHTLMALGNREDEMIYAEQFLRLIVQAILITTPIGFLLTNSLGPMLLQTNQKDCEKYAEPKSMHRKSVESQRSIDEDIRL
ncbi:sodium/hydrogen exchanger 9B2-like [Epargyreus clarus]|uniref:sodium/hydrogen exchanger 9B2-like n=1 Tax=Epargyreus clarus TaxID=520877 RepID=UPI003C30D321